MNKLLGFTYVSLLTSPCLALDIIAPGIPGLIEENGKGVYQVLIKEASSRANLVINEHFFPQKRALKLFFDKNYTCIYAYTDLAISRLGQEQIRASFPLGSFKQYIFTAKGTPLISSVKALKGLRVGGILGDTEQDWFKQFKRLNINYNLVPRIEQNVRMLKLGRLDAMVSFMPDAAKWQNQLNYDAANPLFSAYDRLTCHNNTQGRYLIQTLSPQLEQMKQDGSTKRILGDLYLE